MKSSHVNNQIQLLRGPFILLFESTDKKMMAEAEGSGLNCEELRKYR